jgi:hypothetical protein
VCSEVPAGRRGVRSDRLVGATPRATGAVARRVRKWKQRQRSTNRKPKRKKGSRGGSGSSSGCFRITESSPIDLVRQNASQMFGSFRHRLADRSRASVRENERRMLTIAGLRRGRLAVAKSLSVDVDRHDERRVVAHFCRGASLVSRPRKGALKLDHPQSSADLSCRHRSGR